jgi:hypothetical protein
MPVDKLQIHADLTLTLNNVTGQRKMGQVLGAFVGCWVSSCYGSFSLGARLETYKPFISLIFQNFLATVNRR